MVLERLRGEFQKRASDIGALTSIVAAGFLSGCGTPLENVGGAFVAYSSAGALAQNGNYAGSGVAGAVGDVLLIGGIAQSFQTQPTAVQQQPQPQAPVKVYSSTDEWLFETDPAQYYQFWMKARRFESWDAFRTARHDEEGFVRRTNPALYERLKSIKFDFSKVTDRTVQ